MVPTTQPLNAYKIARPLLFRIDPHTAHALAFAALAPLEHSSLLRNWVATSDARTPVQAMGLRFPSPLGLAGGFDKNGRRPLALAALGFGHIELGTVTARPQDENPRPNLFRLPDDRALINRLGFPNRGAKALAAALRPKKAKIGVPVGVSIGKSRVVDALDARAVEADYLEALDAVADVADFLVVNVSSPNTPNLRAIQSAERAEALLGALRQRAPRLPMLLKVAPDLDDAAFDALLDVIAGTGLDGVVAANTSTARTGLRTAHARIEACGAGGLSGPPLFPRARAMVERARRRLGDASTIVGTGGVSSADDVRTMLSAGANLVQVYTAFVYEGPTFARTVNRALLAGQ